MRYAAARMKRDVEDLAYRIYLTDGIKTMTQTLADSFGGKYIQARYWDILHPQEEDTRTEEEIKAQVFGRIRELQEGGE